MYQCPGCGGGLKFDIPSQQLKCDSCLTLVDPYSLKEQDSATQMENVYEVTMFTCPHCGGEMYSTDNAAVDYCSFCGSHNTLEGRITHEKRPDYIIPFKLTKEDCKNAFRKHVNRSFFIPSNLKNPKNIDSFRGIYMPYWAFYIEHNGSGSVTGKKSYRVGNYRYTDTYSLSFDIDAHYKGLSYDSSSSFYDSISEAIGPYDVKMMREFHPAVLSGFYADTSDVGAHIYQDDAMDQSNEFSLEAVKKQPFARGLSIAEPSSNALNSIFNANCKQTNSAMYPVWFMSYRKGNRVAYATVNGQTGKVFADMPVSPFKYLLCSLAIALPIFGLMCLLFTFTAPAAMNFAAILTLICSIIYGTEIVAIAKKDSMCLDQGVMDSRGDFVRTPKRRSGSKDKGTVITFVLVGLFIFAFGPVVISKIGTVMESSPMLMLVALGGTIASMIVSNTLAKKNRGKVYPLSFIFNIISAVISLGIAVVNPVDDIYYYVGIFALLLTTLITNLNIIAKYNMLATRMLPQFKYTGGDDNA